MKSSGVVTATKQEAMSPGLGNVSRSRRKMYLPQLVRLLSALFLNSAALIELL